ncbi:7-carboxy-7-deazaguanine synthase QueE [bacterium]|nr:7-carboxy-7-deazaguanine synthase QueE [bacterium]
MNNRVKIKEIFASIQGEGPYVGYKQLFIRFCGCNLKCNYCDTEFSDKSDYKEYTAQELAQEVSKYADIHSISLTGGEPLLSTEFLKEFLPLIKKMPPHPSPLPLGEGADACSIVRVEPPLLKGGAPRSGGGILVPITPKIYLETNATLTDKFLEIKPFIDIVSADIKLESATGIKDTFEKHDKFFEGCIGVETFAKIVFNEKITDDEILKSCELGKKYGIELILQPETVSEGRKFRGQEGKLFNDSSLNKIPQQQQTDKNHSTVQPFNPSTNNDFQPSTFHFQLNTILDKFLKNYEKVRLIPQVHKFLNVR